MAHRSLNDPLFTKRQKKEILCDFKLTAEVPEPESLRLEPLKYLQYKKAMGRHMSKQFSDGA